MKPLAQITCRFGGWLLALLIAALSLVPPDLRPESGTPHHFEHFAIFCATGVAFGWGYNSSNRLLLAVALMLFAGAIEFAQLFAPGRHARLSDYLVDALAAGVGIAVSAVATDFTTARRART
jgi:VanZ family protein